MSEPMAVGLLVETLWRLNFNTEKGYRLELTPGGDIILRLDGVVAFRSKSADDVVDKMRSMTIPARVKFELPRNQAVELQCLVCHGKEYFKDHDAVLKVLAAALDEGLPGEVVR